MPIREKAKTFFRRDRANTKSSTTPSTLSKTSTTTSSASDSLSSSTTNKSTKSTRRTIFKPSTSTTPKWPSHVYRPDEPMPRPKYRATPKKEHTAHLAAFSFADSWRKNSFQSQYSPLGTRAPSRRNSVPSRLPSRRNSAFDAGVAPARPEDDGGAVDGAKVARLSTEVERESEEEEEEEMEKERAAERKRAAELEKQKDEQSEWAVPRVLSTARDHTPFTEHDLTLALHRSHLVVPTRS